jgi:hypothetical protein
VTRGTPSSKGSVVRSTSATPPSASHAQVHSVPVARARCPQNCKPCATPCDCAGRDRGRAKARLPDPKTVQSDATCDSSPHEGHASVFGLTPFRGQFAAQKSSPEFGPQGGPNGRRPFTCQRGESVQTTGSCASFASRALPPTICATSIMSALTKNGAASHLEDIVPYAREVPTYHHGRRAPLHLV